MCRLLCGLMWARFCLRAGVPSLLVSAASLLSTPAAFAGAMTINADVLSFPLPPTRGKPTLTYAVAHNYYASKCEFTVQKIGLAHQDANRGIARDWLFVDLALSKDPSLQIAPSKVLNAGAYVTQSDLLDMRNRHDLAIYLGVPHPKDESTYRIDILRETNIYDARSRLTTTMRRLIEDASFFIDIAQGEQPGGGGQLVDRFWLRADDTSGRQYTKDEVWGAFPEKSEKSPQGIFYVIKESLVFEHRDKCQAAKP